MPAIRKLTISGNLSPNNLIAHVESTGAHRCGRSSVVFSADDQRRRRGRRREKFVGVRWRGLDGFADEGGDNGADRRGHATEIETGSRR